MLTMLRFAAHVVVSILMGLLYWRVGDDAAVIYNNAGLLFFNQLFILFAAMMPTIVTCKYTNLVFMFTQSNGLGLRPFICCCCSNSSTGEGSAS